MPSDRSQWYVNSRCINCMASRTMAPDLMKESNGRSVFVRQPSGPDEVLAAWRAAGVCPTGAVEAPADLTRPLNLFPQDLGENAYRLGSNGKSSYGAHSYFAVVDGAGCMIDAPRWTDHLAAWITEMGGLDHILLTHRDDIADAKRYAEHFGSRVWIHEADAASAPFATDIMRGSTPILPLPSIKVIFVPGHTRGSVMYLVDDSTLFSGDSLAWDSEAGTLRAYREFCWYDWAEQLKSLAKLRDVHFSRLFAGHGESVALTHAEMGSALRTFLDAAQ